MSLEDTINVLVRAREEDAVVILGDGDTIVWEFHIRPKEIL